MKLYSIVDAAFKINVPRSALMNAILNRTIPSEVSNDSKGFRARHFIREDHLKEFEKRYRESTVRPPTDISAIRVLEIDEAPSNDAIRVRKRLELLKEAREMRDCGVDLEDLEDLLFEGENAYT